jgi:2-amino-4-hydroxy-6-hydroxymethyldihydropteridine diphosphokinase
MEDPEGAILRAARAIAALPGFRFVDQSCLWVTEPVGGPPGQNPCRNRAAVYMCPQDPQRVVKSLLAVEASMGRVRGERWGPRLIDIDLLYLGTLISDDEKAQVPHPRLHERAFALYPLADVRPGWLHPLLGKSVEDLIAELPPGSESLVRKAPG